MEFPAWIKQRKKESKFLSRRINVLKGGIAIKYLRSKLPPETVKEVLEDILDIKF